MAERERICVICGSQFSYPIGRGKDRIHCSEKCAVEARQRSRARRLVAPPCVVDGCVRSRRAPGSEYCETHYYRLRRTGSLTLKPRKGQHEHSHGYIVLSGMKGHPLATPGKPNDLYEHRAVFFVEHGPGPFSCHHCGAVVTWNDMHVDHLNDDKADNTPANLVASCAACNTWRAKDRAVKTRKDRHGRWIEFGGERLTVSDWARRVGVRPQSISIRIANGWPLERALTEPRGRFGPKQRDPQQDR